MKVLQALLFALLALAPAGAWAQQGELLWLGHSAFRITTPGGKVIVVDPYVKGNPKTPAEFKDLAKLGKVDLILVTHGHTDHVADAAELAKLTGTKIVGIVELPRQMVVSGAIDQAQTIGMNKSGSIEPLGAGIKITMVPADHSSALEVKDAAGKSEFVYAGEAVGYVIQLENGFKIYHAGDTGVFGDMATVIGRLQPDLALLPIGGHFTMGPEEAAHAVSLIKPKKVVPMHYGTFGLLKGTPDALKQAMGQSATELLVMEPGQTVKF